MGGHMRWHTCRQSDDVDAIAVGHLLSCSFVHAQSYIWMSLEWFHCLAMRGSILHDSVYACTHRLVASIQRIGACVCSWPHSVCGSRIWQYRRYHISKMKK